MQSGMDVFGGGAVLGVQVLCVCVCEGGAGGLSARELSVREGENCEGGERERGVFFHFSI